MDIVLLSPWTYRKYKVPHTSLLYLKYYLEDNGFSAELQL